VIVTDTLIDSTRSATPDLIQRLLSVGEGNPYFLQELVKHWLETGKQQGFPASLTAIVDDRLARLSNEALQVLQACAVLGVNASTDRVDRVLEYKSYVLLSAVQELSAAGMLRVEAQAAPDPANQLVVRHDLVAAAALRRLSKAPCAFLHHRAGMVLESETGDGGRTAILWACAFHWRHAGDRERAFRAARTCAEHLLEVGLPRDAKNAFERTLEYCVTDEQRLLVLSRLALSLQMDGHWERSKEILRTSRQLQMKSAPNASTHDEVEFALSEARWRVSLENSALLDDLSTCTRSQEASVSHRVACGLLGLKVATELNRIDSMEELYLVMTPLLQTPEISPVTRFEVEMIYHSTCGDMQRAEEATDQLLRVARTEKDPLTCSRALGNVGVAYRLAGRKADALAIFLETLNHSVEHGLVSRTGFAALALVRTNLAAGDLPRAREAMEKLEALSQTDQDLHRAADRLYLSARLALEEGKLEEASAKYDAVVAQSSPSQSVNRRTADLALGIRIGIKKGASVNTLQPILQELEAAHAQNRSSGWQDFEAYSLALGLQYCGESEKSLRALEEYATVYRRERWALPANLTDLLRQLRVSYAVSATRKIEPLSGVL
jgi:tetratricopeptide (TPR) repeat protein